MKTLTIIILIIVSTIGGSIYGYKQAVKDSSALVRYVEMANGYVHLKILDEKGAEAVREFLVNDIRLTTSIHKHQISEQSLYSNFFGPNNEDAVGTNRIEYYRALQNYFQSQPISEENEQLLQDVRWLLSLSH